MLDFNLSTDASYNKLLNYLYFVVDVVGVVYVQSFLFSVSRQPPGPHGTKYRPVQLTEWLALLAYCMLRSDPGLTAPLSSKFNSVTWSLNHASGILYTWLKMGKTVHTCLNMVQTCLYMFMHVHKIMNVYRHLHKYVEMYITCTYTFMIIYICIYIVHTRS